MLIGWLILPEESWAQDWDSARRGAFDPAETDLLTPPATDTKPSKSREASADGRVTLRNYLSGDQSDTYDSPLITMSFLETDLHAQGLTSLDLRLDLDATFILDFSGANERRFGETERLDQIRRASLTLPLGPTELSLGRHLISAAGNAWVDGLDVNIKFDRGRSEVGVYGGLSPDRFDRSLTVDYQALGLYGALHRNGLDVSGAYNLILFQGTLDRHFIHQRTHWRIIDGLFLSSYLILDLINGPQTTTFLSTLDYTLNKEINFTLNVTQYSLEQYRNQAIYRNIIEPNQALILGDEVVDLTYRRLRLSGSYRFIQDWRSYVMVELKSRAQDGRQAQVYTAGVQADDFLQSRVELDLRGQFAQQFKTENVIIALTARRDLTSILSIDGRFTVFNGETLDEGADRLRLFDEAQEIYLVGMSLYGRLGDGSHLLALTYDGVFEDQVADYKSDEAIMIHTLSLAYSYRY